MIVVVAASIEQEQSGEALFLHLLQVAGDRRLVDVPVDPPPVGPRLVGIARTDETLFQVLARLLRLRGKAAGMRSTRHR